jgi:two-component system LytT family sensor kinase
MVDLDNLKSRISAFWVLHVSGWLAYSGVSVIFNYPGKLADIPQLLLFLAPYAAGFLTCIPLRYFYKKIRFSGRGVMSFIAIVIPASFVAANLWLGIDCLAGLLLKRSMNPGIPFVRAYPSYIVTRGIPLLAWTSLYFGLKIRREWKRQEQRMEKANSLAQDAQLQMLRYQLNPHFLFNSMNSIRALIDEDETKAKEMITELSDFLLYSLVSKDYCNVPLKQEMEAIRHYFAIQKKRYEDKLEVLYDIEPQAGEYPVLSFLIHPLVENAVKYGMRTSPMPLTVQLRAKIRDGVLMIEVRNSGKWIEADGHKEQIRTGTGTGLDNVRRRLENAFPHRHRFEVVEKEGNVQVKLEIWGA